jgi:hypothetical protein
VLSGTKPITAMQQLREGKPGEFMNFRRGPPGLHARCGMSRTKIRPTHPRKGPPTTAITGWNNPPIHLQDST